MSAEQDKTNSGEYLERKKKLFQEAYFRITGNPETNEIHPIFDRSPGSSSFELSFHSRDPIIDITLQANSNSFTAEKRFWTGQIWQIVLMELGDKVVFKDNVEKLNLKDDEALAKIEERFEEFWIPR